MAETYDSVLDRIGAFNAATEAMSKARITEVVVKGTARPEVRVRLARTAEHYAIEVFAPAQQAASALTAMGFAPQGESYVREVRKSERSWNVASELEDVLQDVLGLGANAAVSIETS